MEAELKSIIDKLKVFKKDNQYAVYKPLLLLVILDEIRSGGDNDFPFVRLYDKLTTLMNKYGWKTISRKKAEYPFHFLASSILWETNINKADLKTPRAPSKSEFQHAVGKVNHKVYDYLSEKKEIIPRLVAQIEQKFFASRHIQV